MANRRRQYKPPNNTKQESELGLQRDHKESNSDSKNIRSPRNRRKRINR